MGMKKQGAKTAPSWFNSPTAEDELRKREEILPEIKKALYPAPSGRRSGQTEDKR